ncbi:Uncharacterised protein [Actinobaculum suis]|uniref:Gram-positive cocci surface proteins LPxTG domain-containing protein n=1 Tax=Actinobaculum suis TaxID=1657 RepID=A0A7Z8Y8B9_9ACTO|nr:hypothetical protein [Actinobaculum suis]VDG75776.1 Uncharacterised protein [Actinobaculum suis]
MSMRVKVTAVGVALTSLAASFAGGIAVVAAAEDPAPVATTQPTGDPKTPAEYTGGDTDPVPSPVTDPAPVPTTPAPSVEPAPVTDPAPVPTTPAPSVEPGPATDPAPAPAPVSSVPSVVVPPAPSPVEVPGPKVEPGPVPGPGSGAPAPAPGKHVLAGLSTSLENVAKANRQTAANSTRGDRLAVSAPAGKQLVAGQSELAYTGMAGQALVLAGLVSCGAGGVLLTVARRKA